eukprot:5606360-Pyramimonas_sp.AAC.1
MCLTIVDDSIYDRLWAAAAAANCFCVGWHCRAKAVALLEFGRPSPCRAFLSQRAPCRSKWFPRGVVAVRAKWIQVRVVATNAGRREQIP